MEPLRIEVIDRTYAAILAAKTPAERARDGEFRTSNRTNHGGKSSPGTFAPELDRTSSDTANTCGECWVMEQLDILRHAVEALERMKVPYIVVGSIASIAYGESRFTQDIDIIAAFEMKHVDELMRFLSRRTSFT